MQQLKLNIRQVRTSQDRKAYNAVVFRAYKEEYGNGPEYFARLDPYFRKHQRFIACTVENGKEKAVGTGMFAQSKKTNDYVFLRISTASEYRNWGVMKAVLAHIEGIARGLGVSALTSYCLERFVDLYAKLGYGKVAVLPPEEDHSGHASISWIIRKGI